MLRIQRTYNPDLLTAILAKPKLWDAISEDDSGTPEEYRERVDMHGMYVLALLSGDDDVPDTLHGFVIGRKITDTITEVHVAIDPDHWGDKENVQLGKLACQWFLIQPGTAKLVSSIPVTDKHVLRFAQRVGFKREGVNKKSFRRKGELLDQYYVGMTNE